MPEHLPTHFPSFSSLTAGGRQSHVPARVSTQPFSGSQMHMPSSVSTKPSSTGHRAQLPFSSTQKPRSAGQIQRSSSSNIKPFSYGQTGAVMGERGKGVQHLELRAMRRTIFIFSKEILVCILSLYSHVFVLFHENIYLLNE